MFEFIGGACERDRCAAGGQAGWQGDGSTQGFFIFRFSLLSFFVSRLHAWTAVLASLRCFWFCVVCTIHILLVSRESEIGVAVGYLAVYTMHRPK